MNLDLKISFGVNTIQFLFFFFFFPRVTVYSLNSLHAEFIHLNSVVTIRYTFGMLVFVNHTVKFK